MPFEYPGGLEREEVDSKREADLDRFLRTVEARAYRIAVVSVRDRGEALDIVQDAMIKLATRYAHKPVEEWKPLFFRILSNRVRDWQRRSIVRSRVMSFFGGQEGERPDPVIAAPAPASDDPVASLAGSEAMQALEEAIGQLPTRQREAFMLRTFENMDVAETARAMGCSDGSVKTHHSRAVSRLRELLGDHWS